jgi:hypothetical protein
MSEKVAEAIELILNSKFVPGTTAPTSDVDRQMVTIAATGSVMLRVFQRYGISSREVARALRTGVLNAVPAEG